MDIEKAHVGWITILAPLIVAQDEIEDVEVKAFKSDDEELDGNYVVRITKATPTIEIVARDKEEALYFYRVFNRSKKVIKLFSEIDS